METKNILLILTIIILICVVIGLAIQLQSAKNVTPAVVNNTTNNTTVNTTVEHINNDTALQSNSNNQASHSDSQASQSGMLKIGKKYMRPDKKRQMMEFQCMSIFTVLNWLKNIKIWCK